jgi:Flp pilus assembly protein TadG
MRRRSEEGQAFIIVVAALGLFLLGAVGLAIDASQLYAHRQMAQAAADAAAQAGMMSIYDKTNTGTNAFGTAAFTCSTSDVKTPCVYARLNGFGSATSDVVKVDFPAADVGVTLCSDATNLTRVTIFRTINTGLLRFLGPSTGKIVAQGTAACVDVLSPVPIIVLHPTKSGSFDINGNPTIQICGGPDKSIQVNSTSATSITIAGGSSLVDLSKAGPKNWSGPNSCSGTGADFGDFGGPSVYPSGYNWGTDGSYRQPCSPIKDPLLTAVSDPVSTGLPAGTTRNITGGTFGCPLAASDHCVEYSPGLYAAKIEVKNEFAIFKAGLYYISSGGFHMQSNGEAHMAPCPTTPTADFGCGMMVYNAGTNVANDIFEITSNSGKYKGVTYNYTFPDGTVCTGSCLLGSTDTGIYKGILFFQERSSTARAHSLQGGGGLVLSGTIYLTNTEATMLGNAANYQSLSLQGTPGSTTRVIGMIIVDALHLGGNATIRMTLDPSAKLHIRQVALVR